MLKIQFDFLLLFNKYRDLVSVEYECKKEHITEEYSNYTDPELVQFNLIPHKVDYWKGCNCLILHYSCGVKKLFFGKNKAKCQKKKDKLKKIILYRNAKIKQ
jgi:hypothetical protein